MQGILKRAVPGVGDGYEVLLTIEEEESGIWRRGGADGEAEYSAKRPAVHGVTAGARRGMSIVQFGEE